MKLGILAWHAGESESEGIAAAARARAHETTVFEISDIGLRETPTGTVPTIAGRDAADLDVVVSRAHVGLKNWRYAVERLFLLSSVSGLVMLDPADAHTAAVSKAVMLHRVAQVGVRVPKTRICRNVEDFEAAVADWGAVVVKPSVGHRGIDVDRFSDGLTDRSRARLEQLLATYGELLCQEYLKHDGDWRVHVVDDQVTMCVHVMTDSDGQWKPISGAETKKPEDIRRADIELVTAEDDLADVGLRATAATGLSMAGVDIVRHDGEWVVMEVNGCPAWAFLEHSLQEQRCHEVVDLAERRHQENAARRG
ncbi:ATP-grasp domain-containing protein [Streptomyces albospinus]|nr:hypothetical protein [Streptomyces albospinus]